MGSREMPRLVRLLGFDEEDWDAWLAFKDQMGDAPEIIETVQVQLAEANRRFEMASFQIDVISELLFKQDPEAYEAAVNSVKIKWAGKSG